MTSVPLAPVGPLQVEAAVSFAEEARAALARGGDLTVNLAAVTDLGGAGAQVLVALQKSLARRGDRLLVVETPPNLVPLLQWCGIDPSAGV